MAENKITPETIARWRAAPWQFCEEALADPEPGTAYKLLAAERAFLDHAFRTDEQGRLLYPEQCLRVPKEVGEDSFAAMYALVVVLLFGGGYPETICVANSLEQSGGRVFECERKIVESSPLLTRQASVTAGRITFPSIGATISAIPGDYAGAAGGNQNIASSTSCGRTPASGRVACGTRWCRRRRARSAAGSPSPTRASRASPAARGALQARAAQPQVGPGPLRRRRPAHVLVARAGGAVADERWLAQMRRSCGQTPSCA